VATDTAEIRETVTQFGGEAVLTSTEHSSGTERVAEVARNLPYEIVVDIQGDEPLVSSASIDELVSLMIRDSEAEVATLVTRCHEDELENPNVVKVACGTDDYALYFSRTPVPYSRDGTTDYYKHIGVYGFRKPILLELSALSRSKLEEREDLEQLRALEHHYRIRVVFSSCHTIGVDTPEDVHKVERVLREES
jgi:3-deoxy-manno-octulosonate cytidylyltransferase (CMP-KDO synthetase)